MYIWVGFKKNNKIKVFPKYVVLDYIIVHRSNELASSSVQGQKEA